MLIEEVFFGIAYVIAAAAPLLRFRIGSIPIYWMDVFLGLAFAAIIMNRRSISLFRLSTQVVIVILLLVISMVLLGLFAGGDIKLFVYSNGRRILSMLPFFIAGWICYERPQGIKFIRKIMILGLMFHCWLIILQYALNALDFSLLRKLDDFFYIRLCSMKTESRTLFWQIDWYIPRAFGGYWNANAAIPAIFLPLTFVYFFPYSRKDLTQIGIALVASLLTGSKQALITIMFLVLFNVAYLRNTSGYMTNWFRITIAGLVISFVVSLLPIESYSRPQDVEEGTTTIENSIRARLISYPLFLSALLDSDISLLLFGKGVDFANVTSHSKLDEVQKLRAGFVSNSWLLVIVTQGLLGLLAQLWIYILLIRHSRARPQYVAAFLIYTILAFCDNHIAIYNSLQVIYWTMAGVAAVQAGPVENRAKALAHREAWKSLGPKRIVRVPYSPPGFRPLKPVAKAPWGGRAYTAPSFKEIGTRPAPPGSGPGPGPTRPPPSNRPAPRLLLNGKAPSVPLAIPRGGYPKKTV